MLSNILHNDSGRWGLMREMDHRKRQGFPAATLPETASAIATAWDRALDSTDSWSDQSGYFLYSWAQNWVNQRTFSKLMILIQNSLAIRHKLKNVTLSEGSIQLCKKPSENRKKIGILSLPTMNDEYILVNFQRSCFWGLKTNCPPLLLHWYNTTDTPVLWKLCLNFQTLINSWKRENCFGFSSLTSFCIGHEWS